MHPFFWNPGRRLAFLQDASDRFEIMERDPREPGLVALETGAAGIVGTDWQRKLDKMFIDNLGKFRKYDVKSVQDLLRALRNKVSIFHSASRVGADSYGVEKSLSGPAGQREAASGASARRVPGLLYQAVS
jgi:hypothetical protein